MHAEQNAQSKPAKPTVARQGTSGQRASNSELSLVKLAPRGNKVKQADVEYEFSGIAG